MKHLVIVESPAKAETINKYLGSDYTVLASYGHIRDLPSKNGSVDPDNKFAMLWEMDPRAKKRVDDIAKEAKKADSVILATDPDREGEAISWHVHEVLKEKNVVANKPVQRVVFNEITKRAIQEAMANPRAINNHLVDAYMARRALDYLVGFTLSPVLWRKLPGSRSAGRVQSVALRLICDREEEIEAFIPQEYWSILTGLKNAEGKPFTANLIQLDGNKMDKMSIGNEAQAKDAVSAIESCDFAVKSIESKTVRRNPYPPFITSTLQQEAARKLGFSVSRTMQTAQRLYEGIKLGGETVGLITYMRTDGVNLSVDAVSDMRQFITSEFGQPYLPDAPRVYKSKSKNAQEAHEAIRPTDIRRTPEQVKAYLEEDQLRLYELIWKRALACQMENAVFDQVSATLQGSQRQVVLRATGSVLVFDGYLKLYQESKDDPVDGEEEDKRLPKLNEGEAVKREVVVPSQHFTQPPPRFTEASLVKRMEELGIGRPSTYASIIRILQDRNYVEMDSRRFIPEDRGRLVTTFLKNFFERYVEYNFTADLEEQLDDISGDRLSSGKVLNDFWIAFKQAVEGTKDLTITEVLNRLDEALSSHFFPETEDGSDPKQCPKCGDQPEGGRLSLKLGRYGAFIGCSHYPDCKFTRQLKTGEGDASNDMLGADGPVELGIDPETQKQVTLCKGPYGFYVQLGEEEEIPAEETKSSKKAAETKKPKKPKKIKPKRMSLPQGTDPANVDLEKALRLLTLPRELGNDPNSGQMISTSLGRFGPYIKLGDMFVSVKNDDVTAISLERALEIIEASGKKLVQLGDYKNKPVSVQKGRFGYYISYNRLKINIPKKMDANKLTLEEAVALIEAKLEKESAGKTPKAAAEPKVKKAKPKAKSKAKPKTAKKATATA